MKSSKDFINEPYSLNTNPVKVSKTEKENEYFIACQYSNK
jgi:hypothetical protein